jgi:beta-lactam-binding protein with PASTA domain
VYLEGSGSGDAGMKIWKPTMLKYFQQVPRTGFVQPPRKIQVGKQVRVPSLRGLSIAAATRKLEARGFTVEKRFTYSDTVPKYGFIGWSPGPGSTISEFGSVYGMYSKGRDPAVVAREKADAKKKSQQKKKKSPPQPPQFPPFPPGPR